MKYLAAFFVLAICLAGCSAEINKREIGVYVDISGKNSITVSYNVEYLKADTIRFLFPKSVPGTYRYLEYDSLINSVKAYTADKKLCDIDIVNNRTYQITADKNISSITYRLDYSDDIFAEKVVTTGLITNNEVTILNSSALFGYIDGYTDIPYTIDIKHNGDKKPFTTAILNNSNIDLDSYSVNNYHTLIDNPIIYFNSDMVSYNSAGTVVNLLVYSPTKQMSAKKIKSYAQPVTDVVFSKLKEAGVAPDSYNMTIFFGDNIYKNDAVIAALEHKNSSTYYFRAEPKFFGKEDSLYFANDIKELIAHEIMHVFTPISFREKSLKMFDYEKPEPTEFLWLYEGFVEYYSKMLLYEANLLYNDRFLDRLSTDMFNMRRTRMSFKEYGNKIYEFPHFMYFVYKKGKLFNMGLDGAVRLSNNNKKDLFALLSDSYRSNNYFNGDSLMLRLRGYDDKVASYIDSFLIDNNKILLDSYLSPFELKKEKLLRKYSYFYFPISIKDYNSEDNILTLISKKYDILKEPKQVIAINGERINAYNYCNYLSNNYRINSLPVTLTLLENGKKTDVTLKPKNLTQNINKRRIVRAR
jgi:predicted metalloprotease with PDZ domain